MKKVLLWTVVIIGALVILVHFLPERTDDSKNEKTAIGIIKKSYTPSLQLLSWNPDFADATWVAQQCPQPLCAYSDCYQVTVWVTIIAEGEKKTIKAEWIVYDKFTRYQPENAEARILFTSTFVQR